MLFRSYVVGNEAWFDAHGISAQAVLIGSISDDIGNGASFLTQFEGNTNRYMTMIMINMDVAYIPGLSTGDPLDIDGSLVIDGTTALDMEDGMRDIVVGFNPETGAPIVQTVPSGYGSGYVAVVQSQTAGLPVPPPIFVSSTGGVGYSDLETFTPVTGADVYQGEYLALYWYNLGIALGYNETIPAEPTPPSTPWVTEAHGYN